MNRSLTPSVEAAALLRELRMAGVQPYRAGRTLERRGTLHPRQRARPHRLAAEVFALLPTPRERALMHLEEWLAHGPLPACEVTRRAGLVGIRRRTLRRAADQLEGLRKRKVGGRTSPARYWLWQLDEVQRGSG